MKILRRGVTLCLHFFGELKIKYVILQNEKMKEDNVLKA